MSFCPKCGRKLENGEDKCSNCEKQLKEQKTSSNKGKIPKKAKIIIVGLLAVFIVLGGFVFTSYTKAEKAKEQLNLGNKYLEEGNYEEAILAFNKAIEVEPKNTDARIQLGKAYVITGDTDKAEKILKEVINIDSKKSTAYLELANIYISDGKVKEAKEVLEDGDKKTSDEKLKKFLEETNQRMKVGEIKIGDYIQVGSYLGKPLIWRVVNIDSDGSPLLWLDNILCYKSFDASESGKYGQEGGTFTGDKNRQKYGSSRWANSNLREWLNSSEPKVNYTTQPPTKNAVSDNAYDEEAGFLTNFTKAEQNIIKEVDVKTGLPDIDSGLSNVKDEGKEFKSEVVKDKIFILSYEEWSKLILGGINKNEGMSFIDQKAFTGSSGTKYNEFDFWLRNAKFNGLKGGKYDDPFGYRPSEIHVVRNKYLYCTLGDGRPFGASPANDNVTEGLDKTKSGWTVVDGKYQYNAVPQKTEYSYGVCPALYLNSETIVWSGNGTNSEPYMVNYLSYDVKESYDKMADEIDATVKGYSNIQATTFSSPGNFYTVAKSNRQVCYIHHLAGDFYDYTFYFKDEKLIKVHTNTLKGDKYDYYFKDDNLILKAHYDVADKLANKDYFAMNKLDIGTKSELLKLSNKVLNTVKNYNGIENETGKP